MAKQTSKKKTAALAAGITAGGAAVGKVAGKAAGKKALHIGAAKGEAIIAHTAGNKMTLRAGEEFTRGLNQNAALKKNGPRVGLALGAVAGGAYYYRHVHGKQVKVKNGNLNSQHNFLAGQREHAVHTSPHMLRSTQP